MTKWQFLSCLEQKLMMLPPAEREDRLAFYGEMIDDYVEEGMTPEEAVAAIGSVDDVMAQIITDVPLAKIVKEKITPKRRLRGWEITLLAVGSPVWASLLVGAVAVVLALYVSLWAAVVSLWAAFAAVVGSSLGGLFSGVVLMVTGYVPTGLALVAAALVCGGLSIFVFYGCCGVTKGLVKLTRVTLSAIKKSFIKKGESL